MRHVVMSSLPSEAEARKILDDERSGQAVMDDFLESLQHHAQPASKISMMQLDGRLQTIEELLRPCAQMEAK